MASAKIKGITIEIAGDTTKLGKALESAEQSSKSLQSELKGVNTLLKMDPGNVELLTQKQKILTDSISATEEKLNTLKSAQVQVQEQFDKGKITEQQFRDFQREIIFTEQKLEGLREESKKFGSVMEQQLKVASAKIKEFGGKVKDAGDKVSGLSTTAAAGFSAAVISAATLEDAVAKYIATTGKAEDETEKYQKVLQSIHDNNYGEDYGDIADKMRIVSNILGDLPDNQLQSVVEKTYMLQDAYDMDFQESIRGVNSLMDQFGITADQAYELINQGAQKGLDQNKDLTDQIAEYSTYYAKLGFTADDFFSIMIAGAKDGAYQIDYLNDAMKEFGIRTKDNSKSTNEAYQELGLDVKQINTQFAKGGKDAQAAFKKVVKAIQNVEDPVKKNTIGVALFGTKFEDLEDSAVMAMTTAGNEVNSLGKTVEETGDIMYGSTQKKAEQALKKLKSSFSELGSSVMPILENVIDKVTVWIDKFNSLDDSTKETILTITGLVAALAPVLIIGGKVITGVGAIVGAIGKLGTSLGITTTAQLANNAAVLANPYVLAAAAVVALTVAIVAWSNASDEQTKQMEKELEATKKENEAITDNKNAWDELNKTKQENIASSLSEMDHYEQLYDELLGLVDANGKVKEGYEGRAKFITSTLSEALGIEIELVDGVIQNYNELTDSFDSVMEKKRAMIILEAQEESYKKALTDKANALRNMNELEEEMLAKQQERTKYKNELEEASRITGDRRMDAQNARERKKLKDKIEILDEEIVVVEDSYTKSEELLEEYAYTIGTYEDNMSKYHEEKYNEISNVNYEYVKNIEDTSKDAVIALEKQIDDTNTELNKLKELKAKNNTDIYDNQIEAGEKQLEELQEQLKAQVSSVNKGNSNITNEWLKGQANQLSAATGKTYEFKKVGDGTVQMYINGVKAKEPVAEKDMEKFSSDMINEINKKKKDAETSGKNLIEGVDSGVKNQKKQSSVFSSISTFATNAINKLKSVFKTNSPSKVTTEIGGYFAEGVGVGVDNEKKNVLKDISNFGSDVTKSLKKELSDDFDVNSNFNGTRNLMMNTLTGSSPTLSTNSTARDLQTLTSLMNKYMPLIIDNMGQDIVMDKRVIAKTIAPEVNKELGNITNQEQRGY